jgi:hypothetical protein
MFLVQPILVRKNEDGEIVETLRADPQEIGGVKLLEEYARRFKTELLPEFNEREALEALEAVAAAQPPPPNRAQRRATAKKAKP